MNDTASATLYQRACQRIPGGVNSPVRAFRGVGGKPLFIASAQGPIITDEDGNEYIDYINSWGPMILGHGHPAVVSEIQRQAGILISAGAPTRLEVEYAELVVDMTPGIDMLRLCSSGTEACMSALRLARAATDRTMMIKFDGCYHGHADPFLASAGSGLATLNVSSVPGVPDSTLSAVHTLPYNDVEALSDCFRRNADAIACVIIEPVAGNMGCVPPLPDFLDSVRRLCTQYGSVLIFDEVMTGFRLAAGGAQERFSVEADLVTYGKVTGGGLPVAAFGGKKAIMEQVAPFGPVYQAGTLSGNPVAVAAGLATLRFLRDNAYAYTMLDDKGRKLSQGLRSVFDSNGITATVNNVGSMLSVHFGVHSVVNFQEARSADTEVFSAFFHHMLEHGIYLPPSAFESWFISTSHGNSELERTLDAAVKFTTNR